eukprot:TRINITY_DN1841_c0_g1_i7.p1 TRINITY_DN1841_c0_g1~~TRINITY_DN1841_c0_g1_i7.p1  ORF type:complete len:247 (-),score=62.10 TRINITY_DN1841_c0_g1_i7:128-868(-)
MEGLLEILYEVEDLLYGDDDDDENEESELVKKISFYGSVMKAWSLLVTTLDDDYVINNLIPEIQVIINVMELSQPEIKITAAETLALLVESVKNVEGEAYTMFYFNGFFDVGKVFAQISDLATGNCAKKHRSRFKELDNVKKTLQEGVGPTISLKLKKQQFSFHTWYEARQMSIFRAIFGVGFQHHFLHNELLACVFDITIRKEMPSLTASEKKQSKLQQAKRSKNRNNWINKGRKNKMHYLEDEA